MNNVVFGKYIDGDFYQNRDIPIKPCKDYVTAQQTANKLNKKK